jgi:ArsR family metal-binding transcriptional regulator
VRNEKPTKNFRKKEGPAAKIRKTAIGLFFLALVAMSLACGGEATQAAIPSEPTQVATQPINNYDRPFTSVQLLYPQKRIDGVAEKIPLGNIVLFEFETKTVELPNHHYLSPCLADQTLIQQVAEIVPPELSDQIVDIRADVCARYTTLAREINIPYDQVENFVRTMAQSTIVIKDEEVDRICDPGHLACVKEKNIFLSTGSLDSNGHEAIHLITQNVPNGAYYMPESNVCIINNKGHVIIVHTDDNITSWESYISDELLPILRDLRYTSDHSSGYISDPNSDLSIDFTNIAYNNMSDPLAMLTSTSFLQPTFADLSSIFEGIIRSNGVQLLLEANNELNFSVQPGVDYSSRKLESLTPLQACQQ